MEVSLEQILNAREKRAQKQKALLAQYQKPLICFTMNIPGPEKSNRDVEIGFAVGNWLLQDFLRGHPVLYKELCYADTGCEAWYVVDEPAGALKLLTIGLEDTEPIGRLFDIDILDVDGKKLTREEAGFERRKCLICDNDAAVCARSRAHGLEALRDRTGFLLYLAARQWMAEYIAVQAYLALNKEFTTTPKPGLVDRNNRGSHPDMGIKHFFASANALRPYLCRFAETGFLTRDAAPTETFRQIRSIGKEAEQAMYQATGGINTHKGAIFSMGLFCAAAGRLSPRLWTAQRLCAECAAMTEGVTARDFAGVTMETAKTAGEQIFAQYGIAGVRGQAEAGFPAVLEAGLPVLRQGLEIGLSFNDAGCATLLHLIAATDDTNLIHRSDRQTQLQVKAQIAKLIAETPYPTPDVIEQLDREFIEKNLSPGGSADLLAVTYFLQYIEAKNSI
jgi:holo-ACP synthase/triphosphoribosyl-dephospho-CoA synthase